MRKSDQSRMPRHAHRDDPDWPEQVPRVIAYLFVTAWIAGAVLCIALVVAVIWLVISLALSIGA